MISHIRAGALARREIRAILVQYKMQGKLEYREVKGLLDSIFVIDASQNVWNFLISIVEANKN